MTAFYHLPTHRQMTPPLLLHHGVESRNSTTASTKGSCVAVLVVTSAELFLAICAFLPGKPTWRAELERKKSPLVDELALTLQAKQRVATPGLLPFLAIQHKNMRTLQRLWILHKQPLYRKNPQFWFQSAMHDAATMGNLKALEWLHATTGAMCEPSALSLAARHGFGDVVRWLLVRLPKFELEAAQRAMSKAAVNGHLDVLQAFHEWRKDACTSQSMDLAAEHEHLDIVTFLHEQARAVCTTDAVDKAAENGHVHVVKWILSRQPQCFTQAATRGAVANGHVAVFQCLCDDHGRRDGPQEDSTMFTKGIRAGVPLAIRNKHLAMLRYLHESVGDNAFPRYTLSIAAEIAHDLAVFQFLHSTHRPREDIDLALRRGIEDCAVVNYLLANESFSLNVLTTKLISAKAVDDKDVSARNVLALQIAIAQKMAAHEIDTRANGFALTLTTSTATIRKCRTKARRTRARAWRAPHPQSFLLARSSPETLTHSWFQ